MYFDAVYFHRIGEIWFWNITVVWGQLSCNAMHNALLLQNIMTQYSVFWCTVVPENEWDLVSDPAPGLSPAPTSFFCILPLQRTWNAVLYMLVAPQPIFKMLIAYPVTRGAILCPPAPLNILGLGGVRVPIFFGDDLLWNDLPYSKGFVKFGCPEPSTNCLTFETFVRQRGIWPDL